MAEALFFSPLIHDIVKRAASWHSLVGGPGFPEKWLYGVDPSFGAITTISISLDSKGKPSKIVGSTAASSTCSIEFSLDEINVISKVTLKRGTTEELKITEQMSGNTLIVDTKYPSNSAYDVQKRVTKPTSIGSTTCAVEIDINGSTLNGSVDILSTQVPQIALDYANALKTLSSNAKIAAQNVEMGALVAFYYWQGGSYGTYSFANIIDALATGLSDVDGPIITGLVGMGSTAMCDYINTH